MKPGTPGGDPGGTLVDEIHQQRVRAVAERARQRKRRTRVNIVFGIVLFAALVVAGVVVKHLVDQHRIDEGVSTARTHMAASTPADLERAIAQLEQNLGVERGHPRSLGLMALTRAQQAALGVIELDEARSAIDKAAEVDREEAPLATGILAALEGDFDEARRAYEATPTDAESELASTAAWLQGLVALGRPYEKELTEAALTRIGTAIEQDPTWVSNRRVMAALLARQGRFDDALVAVEEARAQSEGHIGLSVDEALYHALTYQHAAGVLEVTEIVLMTESTPPQEAAHARLARGVALIHDGEIAEGVAALEACWATLPPWDNHGRDLVLESLLTAGKVDKAKTLRKEMTLGSQADAIFEAWLHLLDGDAGAALDKLKALPQDLPRVGHLQALALAEQRRWDEAQRWVTFALGVLPHRPDLAVAQARAQTQGGDASALERLEKLSKEHPFTYRVWTALAEAHARVEEPSKKQVKAKLAAIDKATKREPGPAEAMYLLGTHYKEKAADDPKAAADALDGFRKATKAAPGDPRYAAAYGVYLAALGQWAEAEEVLRKAIGFESAGAEPFVALVKMMIDRSEFKSAPVPKEVEAWLAEAAKRGGDPWELELEWARLMLARGTQESVPQAELRAARLLEKFPRHIQGRVIHAMALTQQGRFVEARLTLRKGINRTLRKVDGMLYVTLAKVDLADGKKRPAAKTAFRGWGKMVREPAPAADLLLTAPFVAGIWLEIEATRPAITVAKDLSEALPFSADAWVFRGGVQLAAKLEGPGCASAAKALELDEELPSAHALLGDCWKAKYKFDKAKAAYLKAAKLAKGTVAATEYQRKARRL